MSHFSHPSTDLQGLADLVEHERVVMLTTATPQGGLRSRPMTVIDFDGDGCFWYPLTVSAACACCRTCPT